MYKKYLNRTKYICKGFWFHAKFEAAKEISLNICRFNYASFQSYSHFFGKYLVNKTSCTSHTNIYVKMFWNQNYPLGIQQSLRRLSHPLLTQKHILTYLQNFRNQSPISWDWSDLVDLILQFIKTLPIWGCWYFVYFTQFAGKTYNQPFII